MGNAEAPAIIQPLLDLIHASRSFCVVGHIRPDGDCIGSQLAMGRALRALGKEVAVWNADPAPANLAFLDPEGWLQPPQPSRHFDCVIATDAANLSRLGPVADHIREREHLINIDHHESNPRFGDINWVDPASASTGELVYELYQQAGWPMSSVTANGLLAAISTDTGSFQYGAVRPRTFEAAADLLRLGADLADVCQRLYQSQSRARVDLLRHVYRTFRLSADGRIAWFRLRPQDFARTGADRSDTEGLIDHVRALDSVVVACVFEETDDGRIRLSLRSKDPAVDVNRVAAQFGGGGHPAAAGARVTGSLALIQRRVLSAVRKALDSTP